MSEDKDRTSRIAERIKRDREPGTFERYNNDILHYLREKFPDEPESAIYEAAAFVSNRTVVVVNDLIIETIGTGHELLKELKGD